MNNATHTNDDQADVAGQANGKAPGLAAAFALASLGVVFSGLTVAGAALAYTVGSSVPAMLAFNGAASAITMGALGVVAGGVTALAAGAAAFLFTGAKYMLRPA